MLAEIIVPDIILNNPPVTDPNHTIGLVAAQRFASIVIPLNGNLMAHPRAGRAKSKTASADEQLD